MEFVGLRSSIRLLACAALLASAAFAQETRGAIFGRILDPQSAAIPAASVTVTNLETNTAIHVKTNDTGYYEANLLLPGTYQVTAEAGGFKTINRRGITVPVGTRVDVSFSLAVGAITDAITVEANALMLDTENASAGKAINNQEIMELPNMGNNAVLLAQMAAGMETSGTTSYMGLHSNMGASDYYMYGNIGGNDWSLDGAANVGQQRRMAFLPYNDAIAEFKVDTANFDASVGHSTGVSVSMMTRSGTNALHGSANWQYWNARWNGTPFFSNKSYYTNYYTALYTGNTALANSIKAQGSQMPGHSHNYAGTIGGPVWIPKLFNGKNKLFWFAEYNGFKDLKTDDPTTFNHTVPTAAERSGDFSDLLKVNNSSQYIIYDPLSTIPDASRSGHVVRTAFPNNVIPSSRQVNPMMKYYTNLMPNPNALPTDPTQVPTNDYFAGKTPYNWDFNSVTNRYDYNPNDRNRFYARWTWESWRENRNDWMYETAPGLNSNGQIRKTQNGALGWTFTLNPLTVVDATVSINEYREGNMQPVATAIKPSDVGLPTYMDTQAGGMHEIPYVSINSYTSGSTSSGYAYLPNGYPSIIHYRTPEERFNVTRIHGRHTFHAGLDMRQYFKTGGGGGSTSGSFTFDNTYLKKSEDSTTSSNLGLAWASFQMGFPSGYSESVTQPLALDNNYYGIYLNDSWRVSDRLTLTLGLRAEYETGITERYNRLYYFDSTLPMGQFATDAQTAYASILNDSANAGNTGVQFLKSNLPASSLTFTGGNLYPGLNGTPRNIYKNYWMWLPRLGWAYQINTKTVFRGGYGLYYDTNNSLFGSASSGVYNSSTSNPGLTSDNGQTWNVANPIGGSSILSDPFPAIYNGQRFIQPVANAYGLYGQVGSNPSSFAAFDWKHARQQRWRMAVERQLSKDLMLEVAYDGSYSDQISTTRASAYVPAQYWNFSNSRNDTVAAQMTATIPNPFATSSFADFKTSNPTLYTNILNSSGFFTSKTIQVAQLIRGFAQMNGNLNQSNWPAGLAKTHSLTVNLTKRFSQGFMMNFGWTTMSTREATGYFSAFDRVPYWRDSNNGRPERIAITGIYRFPFGKGKKYLQHGIPNFVLGGWEVASTYQYQPGPMISWSTTLFYNGDRNNICSGSHTLDAWFNTSGFVTASAAQATSYQAGVFPQYMTSCRSDNTNLINGTVMRDFKLFKEGAALQIRLDVLNATNHPQFSGPNTSPTSTQFGQITSQSSQINRLVEITAHIKF